MVLQLILTVLAVNLDSLVIGAAYGMTGMDISVPGKLALCGSSAFIFAIAIYLGNIMSAVLPSGAAHAIAAVMLFLFGAWLLHDAHKSQVGVLKNPHSLDYNQDNMISLREGIMLGLALSADAFGAGLALGVLACSLWLAVLAAFLTNYLFLVLGRALGRRACCFGRGVELVAKGYGSYLPAIVILLLALWKVCELIV